MRIAPVALVLMLAPLTAFAAPLRASGPAPAYRPGEVLVAVAPGAGLAAAADGRAAARNPALAAALARLGLTHARNLRTSTDEASRRAEVLLLTSDQAGFDPAAAAAELRSQPGVLGASPNVRFQLHTTPNDPYLGYQWHLGNSAAAIHAPSGWSRETGNASVLIAILDTGVDPEHSDLVSKIWTNPGEIPGNGIDDDHDGFQDDVHGWDFGSADNDPSPEPIADPATGIDVGWHGTFVAGLAAAATNNGVGVAGVAWGCKILPIKISDAYGDMTLSAIASGFDYAIARHAAVINLSLGTEDPSVASLFQVMVNEAFNGNALVVASAGNQGTDTPTYPAACDSVLAVASTNASNVRSSWSNWGWYVDICAPGENVWSTIARNYAYDSYSLYWFQQLWGFDGLHAYMSNDGTSFSAPLVAGAAALLRSHYPWLDPTQISYHLRAGGDVKLYDDPIGPKLDLDKALTDVSSAGGPAAFGTEAFAPPSPNPASAGTTLRFTLVRPGRARLEVFDTAGRQVRALLDGERSAGEQSVAWDLRDAAGRAAPAGLYFARLQADGVARIQRLAIAR